MFKFFEKEIIQKEIIEYQKLHFPRIKGNKPFPPPIRIMRERLFQLIETRDSILATRAWQYYIDLK